MTQPNLLPCPFCGGEDIELWTGFGTQAEIGCQSCGCERAVQVADMREDGEPYPEFDNKTFRYPDWLIKRTNDYLVTDWNTRATIPAMREALEHYAKDYCEGWCKDAPPQAVFPDCGGCKARAALAATGHRAGGEVDPNDIWERYLDQLEGEPSPQGAIAFACEALAVSRPDRGAAT